MTPETAAEVLKEWERQRGDEFRAHFKLAYSYLSETVRELASPEAAWTITPHAGHPVLLLAGSTAFALLAFSGTPDHVTMSGALHPLDEGVIRVSFNDQPAADEVHVDGAESFRPMVRQWAFDWHGRLQLPIEYWLTRAWPPAAEPVVKPMLAHHERQRVIAHKLARAAGWPLADAGIEGETSRTVRAAEG
jgi:hypothetical protein